MEDCDFGAGRLCAVDVQELAGAVEGRASAPGAVYVPETNPHAGTIAPLLSSTEEDEFT